MNAVVARLYGAVQRTLLVPADPAEPAVGPAVGRAADPAVGSAAPDPAGPPPSRRRRVVVAVTLVVGAVLLGVSLNVRPGDPSFYLFTVLVAAVWLAGGLLSGPLRLGALPGRTGPRRPVVAALVTGLVLAGVFLAGAFVVREVPPLRDAVDDVLALAGAGATLPVLGVTVLNGVAEEVFFRGALYAAIGRHRPVLVSTVVYAIATVATGNAMLVFAAATVGAVLGLSRRATGGILAPIVTHVTWSTAMLFALPPLFGAG